MSQTFLTSVYGRKAFCRRQWLEMDNMPIGSPRRPNLPNLDLLNGSGEDYHNFGIPLYQASIKCDWKSAKAIFDIKPELVRYSLTENGETALHIAVSTRRTAKSSKQVDEFVENLVQRMDKEDLTLQNRNYDTALCFAFVAGNNKAVEIMVKKNEALLAISGCGGKLMPLCAAVLFKNDYQNHPGKLIDFLYKNSHNLQGDDWTEKNCGVLLENCVELDLFDVAKQIVKDYPKLASNRNLLQILAGKPEEFSEPEPNIIGRILSVFIFTSLERGFKERKALQLLKIILEKIGKKPKREIDEIFKGPQDALMQVTKPNDGTVDQSLELQKVFSEHFVNLQVETRKIIEQDAKLGSVKKDQAKKLEKVISENITKMQVKIQGIIRGPAANDETQVLFIAAESGNTTFIVEILRKYPDLIWSVNDNHQSIFHIAVKHRHVDIYNLLDEIGAMKYMITSLIDDRGNNMLHLAAKIMKIEDVPGVALLMLREVSWFQEIMRIIHPSCIEQKNEDGLTPIKLFLEDHRDLAAEGGRRMQEIARQYIVVAALIATMVFTAAFTIPGGYDQNNGIPIFHSKTTFKIFVVADAISLFSSTVSILYMFLSAFIMSRNVTIFDFLKLPKKLIIGLSYLFLSITSMIIAFIASFFVLYDQKGLLWIPILSIGFALIPFAIYTAHFSLFVKLTRSTYDSRHLFKHKKYFLFHQNPQV